MSSKRVRGQWRVANGQTLKLKQQAQYATILCVNARYTLRIRAATSESRVRIERSCSNIAGSSGTSQAELRASFSDFEP